MSATAPPATVLARPKRAPTSPPAYPFSPHLDYESVLKAHAAHNPLEAIPAHSGLVDLWGTPAFEARSVKVDGSLERVYFVRGYARLGRPVMVRQDHVELWKELEEKESGFNGALWGQPAAGKSWSLHVFSALCSERKIPFARYELGTEYASLLIEVDYGDGDGLQPTLYTIRYTQLAKLNFSVTNYVFVDAGSVLGTSVPGEFSADGNLVRSKVLLATPPQEQRYRAWVSNRNVKYAVMGLFSREEIQAVSYADHHREEGEIVPYDEVKPVLPSGYPLGGYSQERINLDLKNPLDPDGKHWSVQAAYLVLGPNPRYILHSENRVRKSDSIEADLLAHLNPFPFFSSADETDRFLAGVTPNMSPVPAKGFHLIFYETPNPRTPSPTPNASSAPPSTSASAAAETSSSPPSSAALLPISRFTNPPAASTFIPTKALKEFLARKVEAALMTATFDLLAKVTGTGTVHGVVFETAMKFLLSTRPSATLHLLNKKPVVLRLSPSVTTHLSLWDPDDAQDPIPINEGLYHLPTGYASADAFLIATIEPPVAESPVLYPATRSAIAAAAAAAAELEANLTDLTLNSEATADIVLQMTVAKAHAVKPKGVDAIREGILRRNTKKGHKRRPLIFAFAAPTEQAGRRLAVAAQAVHGYDEVGWIVVDKDLVSTV